MPSALALRACRLKEPRYISALLKQAREFEAAGMGTDVVVSMFVTGECVCVQELVRYASSLGRSAALGLLSSMAVRSRIVRRAFTHACLPFSDFIGGYIVGDLAKYASACHSFFSGSAEQKAMLEVARHHPQQISSDSSLTLASAWALFFCRTLTSRR